MQIILPSVSLVRFPDDQILEKLEQIARTCYKSEDKITPGTAAPFITDIVASGHEAMIEHHVFVLNIDFMTYCALNNAPNSLKKYINMTDIHLPPREYPGEVSMHRYIVSGSARAFKDAYKMACCGGYIPELRALASIIEYLRPYAPPLFSDVQTDERLPYSIFCVLGSDAVARLTIDERLVHQYETAHFICDRGVTHEIVRHRPASYAQESTRYCNYSLGKYGSEITVIKPYFWNEGQVEYLEWLHACLESERRYFKLLGHGAKAQQARSVLPTSLKAELWMTASLQEWLHFFELRDNKAAHPQMQEVAHPLHLQFQNKIPDIFL